MENQIKELNIENSLKDTILINYQQRWEKMYHPVIIISYYLDPRYRGQELAEKYSFTFIANEISKYIDQDLSGQLAKELLYYNNKTGPFNLSMFWKSEATKNPIDWWNGFQSEVQILGKFAVKLMSIPASNAASERNWSNFGFIQNIKRNRLTNERTFKLISIYANLRLINNQKLDDITEEQEYEEQEEQNEIIIIEESEINEVNEEDL